MVPHLTFGLFSTFKNASLFVLFYKILRTIHRGKIFVLPLHYPCLALQNKYLLNTVWTVQSKHIVILPKTAILNRTKTAARPISFVHFHSITLN